MTKKSYTTDQLCRRLEKKGFTRKSSKKNHTHLYLIVNGRYTHINTHVSHGKKSVSKGIISKMSHQLDMESIKEFMRYLDCDYSYTQYINDLRQRTIIEI